MIILLFICGINIYSFFSSGGLGITQAIYGQPAVYNASSITLEDQQGAALNVDVNGNLKIVDKTAGGSFSSTISASSTIGTTAIDVLSASTTRQYAFFSNDGDANIYLFLGASTTAEVGKGIRLNSSGGSYEINGNNLYTGIVSAISSSSDQNLTVVYK